jgi:hypothetical protein
MLPTRNIVATLLHFLGIIVETLAQNASQMKGQYKLWSGIAAFKHKFRRYIEVCAG